MTRIAYVTTNRSDYSPVYWLLHELHTRPDVVLQLIVGGAHLSVAHGNTGAEIAADGWPIAAQLAALPDSSDPLAYAQADGAILADAAAILTRLAPDVIILFGDRHETLAVAMAALLTGTPIAHISGGDITSGAIDDAVRHALTKLAHVHFPAGDRSAARLRQMGEEPWRVHPVGDPALDHFVRGSRADAASLAQDLGFTPDAESLLVTFHPVTQESDQLPEQLTALITALESHPGSLILTGPAADPGHEGIRLAFQALAHRHPRAVYVESLGGYRYRGVMQMVGAMVGNSSSGLVEAPCVPLPVVNIGNRQAGRDRAINVIDVPPTAQAIGDAIRLALSPAFRKTLPGLHHPYGNGGAAAAIADIVTTLPSRATLLSKRFIELSVPDDALAPTRPLGGDFALAGQDLFPGTEAAPWFATGRAALTAVMAAAPKQTGYWLVPAFMCPVVPHWLQRLGYAVQPYPWLTPWEVDADALAPLLAGAAGILVPFHLGHAPDPELWGLLAGRPLTIVEDRCHVVAMPPSPGELRGDFAIGSFRKWLPTPDGAYAVGRNGPLRPASPVPQDYVDTRLAAQMVRQISTERRNLAWENLAVDLYRSGEALADSVREPGAAGPAADLLLTRADVPAIQAARRHNGLWLAERLADLPIVRLVRPGHAGDAAQLSLLVAATGDRDALWQRLAAARVFCAVHWRDGDWAHTGGRAADWGAQHLSLPIDQRYGPADLQRIVDVLHDSAR